MKTLWIIVIALFFALWVGLGLHHHSGLIIILSPPWRIELPLWLGMVILFLAYILVQTLIKVTTFFPRLKARFFRHREKRLMRLMKKGFLALAENQLDTLLPELKAYRKNLSKETFNALERNVFRKLLIQSSEDLKKSESLWKQIPKRLRCEAPLVTTYAKTLERHGKVSEAEGVLRNALNARWDEEVIRLYGCLCYPHAKKQLAMVTRWQRVHSESPGLLFALEHLKNKQHL